MTRYEAPLTAGAAPETGGIRDADVVVLGLGPGGEDAPAYWPRPPRVAWETGWSAARPALAASCPR
jgi:hypothetical protein